MNIPTKITLFRIFLVPVFAVLALSQMKFGNILAAAVFIIASISDFIDGYYARRYNMVTNLGKFLDPLADKILVLTAMIILVSTGRLAVWILIVIMCRDFMVDGLRLLAIEHNEVIAASKVAKLKTAMQMVMVIVLLLSGVFTAEWYIVLCHVITALAVWLTVYTGCDYVVKGRKFIQ